MKSIVTAIGLFLLSCYAGAVDLPYTFHYEDRMKYRGDAQDKMYGYIDIKIDEEGKGIVVAKFSNGQQASGDKESPYG